MPVSYTHLRTDKSGNESYNFTAPVLAVQLYAQTLLGRLESGLLFFIVQFVFEGVPCADHDHLIFSQMVHIVFLSSPKTIQKSLYRYLPTQNFSNTSSMTASPAFWPVRP